MEQRVEFCGPPKEKAKISNQITGFAVTKSAVPRGLHGAVVDIASSAAPKQKRKMGRPCLGEVRFTKKARVESVALSADCPSGQPEKKRKKDEKKNSKAPTKKAKVGEKLSKA